MNSSANYPFRILELIKCQTPLKQVFYETECIKNNWSVRELQRAMNTMLYERTGLSTDKKAVLQSINNNRDPKPENIFRNPYMLEFLGLEENAAYSETAMEAAIVSHLQKFLIELGRGFYTRRCRPDEFLPELICPR
jgi:predicted nuclease of restriction endonuclease-like (RecB) superfamily